MSSVTLGGNPINVAGNFPKSGDAAARIVQDALFGLENGIKVQRKQLDALLDDGPMKAKQDAEAELKRLKGD